MEIKPFYGVSKRCYLQELCNKFGDFKVAKGWKNEKGDIIWSKHRNVLECWESEEGLRFLDEVNNRAGFKCELRIDTDPENGETPEQSLSKFNDICDWLEAHDITNYQGFHSGSRGYHIHYVDKTVALWDQKRLDNVKRWILKHAGADLHKVTNSSMLTLEWGKNNKTGKLKVPIRGNFKRAIWD